MEVSPQQPQKRNKEEKKPLTTHKFKQSKKSNIVCTLINAIVHSVFAIQLVYLDHFITKQFQKHIKCVRNKCKTHLVFTKQLP